VDALPGWGVFYQGVVSANPFTNSQTQIAFNAVTPGIPQVVLLGINAPVGPSIEGAYNVLLQGYSGFLPAGATLSASASINQTGAVPATAQSILFKAQPGTESLSVSLGGANIPFTTILMGPNYTMYGGDISPFANEALELQFTAEGDGTGWNIDSIEFSSQPIPEPSAFALLAGALGLLFTCRHRTEATNSEA
jgi:hypothetical protein